MSVRHKNIWAPSSEFVSSSIPSWQISTTHVQPFRGTRDLAFCLKVPLDSLLVWASSEGSGETARMRRLAWTFAARIGDKYQIRLTRSICSGYSLESPRYGEITKIIPKLSSNTLLICSTDCSSDLKALCYLQQLLYCHMSRLVTKPTKWHVPPAKPQIRLGIRPVWSESSLSAWRKLGSLATHWVHSEGSNQTGQMPRLIWVFVGCRIILLVLSRGGSYENNSVVITKIFMQGSII